MNNREIANIHIPTEAEAKVQFYNSPISRGEVQEVLNRLTVTLFSHLEHYDLVLRFVLEKLEIPHEEFVAWAKQHVEASAPEQSQPKQQSSIIIP